MSETRKATMEIGTTDGTTVTWFFESDDGADAAASLMLARFGKPDSIRC